MRGWIRALVGLSLLGAIPWLALLAPQFRVQHVRGYGLDVPLLAIPLPAFIVGVAVALVGVVLYETRRGADRRARRLMSWRLGAVALITILAGVITSLDVAVETHELHGVRATLVSLFAGLSVISAFYALEGIRTEHGISLESSWGGLGGGLGGWRLSGAGAATLLTLILCGGTVAIAVSVDSSPPAPDKGASSKAEDGKPPPQSTANAKPSPANAAAAGHSTGEPQR